MNNDREWIIRKSIDMIAKCEQNSEVYDTNNLWTNSNSPCIPLTFEKTKCIYV